MTRLDQSINVNDCDINNELAQSRVIQTVDFLNSNPAHQYFNGIKVVEEIPQRQMCKK